MNDTGKINAAPAVEKESRVANDLEDLKQIDLDENKNVGTRES